jgi:signal peptidase I
MRKMALLLPTLVLAIGCGTGKGGGTTIVVTTRGSATTPAPQVREYRVPAGSMEPTLKIGSYVDVEAGQPAVGKIAVIHPPEGAVEEKCGGATRISPGGAACDEPVPTEDTGTSFVKRIVAGPGDTIEIVEGHVILNGKREADSYIRPCPGVSECNFPVPITIPAGDWFMMGDNRGESDDSRFWGPVPSSWMIGLVRPTSP